MRHDGQMTLGSRSKVTGSRSKVKVTMSKNVTFKALMLCDCMRHDGQLTLGLRSKVTVLVGHTSHTLMKVYDTGRWADFNVKLHFYCWSIGMKNN